jgi:small-conductance mechanosensitive channel
MVGLFASQYILTLPPKIDKVFNNIFIISFFIQLLIWGNQLVKFSLIKLLTKDHKKPNAKVLETLPVLTIVSKFVLFTIILLLALDNLGFNVSTLVASLGIGGIAIALALQNVLGDLFASLSIVLDKPFKVGDFIILDNYLGSIEKIGLKSTHIRSLGGEQIICSNTDLLKSRIRNYQRMDQRRVVFEFGIIYQTSNEILHSIAERVKKIINNIERTRFDRAHFKNFGDSSLNFEVVYYVLSPDFNIYMDIQQSINLELHRQFEKDGIDFAYPTRTIYMEGSKN